MICVCASRLLTCYFIITNHIISTLSGQSWSWRTLDTSCVRAPNEMLHKCLHRNMFQHLPVCTMKTRWRFGSITVSFHMSVYSYIFFLFTVTSRCSHNYSYYSMWPRDLLYQYVYLYHFMWHSECLLLRYC